MPPTTESEICAPDPCPIDCQGNWTGWDACSRSCAGGVQYKEYVVAVQAQFGGTDLTCEASDGSVEQQFCNEHPCPIDAVCDWSEWSACAATCGNGTRERMWVEIAPAQFGGLSCTAAGPESTGRRLQSSGTMNSTAYATVALNGTHHLAWDGDIVEYVNETHHIAHDTAVDETNMNIIASVVLDIALESIVAGSAERAAFEGAFMADMASALGIVEDRVRLLLT